MVPRGAPSFIARHSTALQASRRAKPGSGRNPPRFGTRIC
jgi:hypothetical protein